MDINKLSYQLSLPYAFLGTRLNKDDIVSYFYCLKYCEERIKDGFNEDEESFMELFSYLPFLKDVFKELYKISEVKSNIKFFHLKTIEEANHKITAMEKEVSSDAKIAKMMEEQITCAKENLTLIVGLLDNGVDSLFKNINMDASRLLLDTMYKLVYEENHRDTVVEQIQKYIKVFEKKVEGNHTLKCIDLLCKELNLDNKSKEMLIYFLYGFTDLNCLENVLNLNKTKSIMILENLKKFGILDEDEDITSFIISYLDDIEKGSHKPFMQYLIKPIEEDTQLNLSDYSEDLKPKIECVIKLIENHDGKRPLNILFWGSSGCGKTSLIRYLKQKIKRNFCEINKKMILNNPLVYRRVSDSENEERDISNQEENFATKRLRHLRLCNHIALPNTCVFIMDECDDTLNSSHGTSDFWLTGKREMNEVLDEVTVPVIWVTNHINEVDQSTFRRFQYSVKFKDLNSDQRTKVWQTQLKLTKTMKYFTEEEIKNLSREFCLNPGIIESSLNNLKALNPKKEDAFKTLTNLLESYNELLSKNLEKDTKKPENKQYSLEGLNVKSEVSLEDITKGVKRFSEKLKIGKNETNSLNLLLHGCSGSGKTEYAKFLARELEMPLITCCGSSFLSKYVGETEENIKNQFAVAEESKSILFIDEADGLIHQREGSKNSWEVTQVNEFLTHMEKFKGILICATNFVKNMDDASIRRFSVKVEFDFLTPEGKVIFFNKLLKPICNETPNYEKIKKLSKLTPGDFKAIRDKFTFIYDNNVPFGKLLEGLEKESSMKDKSKIIGF